MTTVTVYSKLRNCVELRLYKNVKAKDKDGVGISLSQVLDKVIVKGINRYLIEQNKTITLLGQLAKTEVSKDFWDAYVKETTKDGKGNAFLAKKQIFIAKNDAEATAMLIEAPKFFCDMKTPADLKTVAPQGRDLV